MGLPLVNIGIFQQMAGGPTQWLDVTQAPYNADRTGNVDSTTSIRSAMSDAQAARMSYSGNASLSVSEPIVYFPNGTYLISDSISQANVIEPPALIFGSGAIIKQADPTKNILEYGQPRLTYAIQGLTLVGGRYGIYKNLNNVNGGTLVVSNCTLVNQVSAGYYGESTDRGDAIFYTCAFDHANGSASAINAQGGDYVSAHNCRINTDAGDAIVIGSCSSEFHKIFGGATGNGGYWFRMETGASASIIASTFRMGGDNSKKSLYCKTGAANSSFVLENSPVYSPAGGPGFVFDDIPDLFVLRNLVAGSTTGVSFTNNCPAASIRAIGRGKRFCVEGVNDPLSVVGTLSNSQAYGIDTAGSQTEPLNQAIISGRGGISAEPWAEDYVLGVAPAATAFGFQGAGSSTNISSDNAQLNHAGSPIQVNTATAQGASAGGPFQTGIAYMPNGIYTAIYSIDVRIGPIRFNMQAADSSRTVTLETGRHVLCLPFVKGPSTSLFYLGAGVNSLPNGAQYSLGQWRVFKGRIESFPERNILSSVAAPVTGYWERGDIYELAKPSAGAVARYRCVTAGYATSGAWAQSTMYTAGQQWTSGSGAAYYCSTTGTSSSAGTGPTGTGSLVTDGTCTWEYLGYGFGGASSVAVFKAEAALAA